MPVWITLLLAFWCGGAFGFGLAIAVMARMNRIGIDHKKRKTHES